MRLPWQTCQANWENQAIQAIQVNEENQVKGKETNLPGAKGPPAGDASSISSLSSSFSRPMLEMSRRLAWLGLASAFLKSNSSSMVVITTCSISWASCSSVLILQPWALRAARRRAGDREAGEEEAELRLFSCLSNSNKLPLTVRASLLEQVSSSQPWNDYFEKGQHYTL